MSDFFRNTLSAWQWALLALVPVAIVALYFLKLKRQPLEVPSTYLWQQAIEDLRASSLWQRLRRSLLLFLQLLLVALVILALLRPGWRGTTLEGQRLVFLVDNSASMSATDVAESPNRLGEAKRLAAGLIGQMDDGMTAMIISFADAPQVVQEFTGNRRLLLERLEATEPTAHGTDLSGAVELVSALVRSDERATGSAEATLYILSDGRFENVREPTPGNVKPVYVPIGSLKADNLAITALSTRRSETESDQWQALVQVANFTDQPQSAIVELDLDGRFLDAQQIEVAAGESSSVVFALASVRNGGLTARLKYNLGDSAQRDALPLDDVAYAALSEPSPGRVLLVTPGNIALEASLTTDEIARLADVRFATPDVLATDEYRRGAEAGEYDLVIYDQCAPPAMPRASTLFIGRVPPEPAWATSGSAITALPQVLDWNRAHPLLANIELGNVDIADSLVVEPPAGGDVLIDSTAGPIAVIAPRGAYEDVVLGFEIVGRAADGSQKANTNWPRRLSFPTFWFNAVEYFAGEDEQQRADRVQPGHAVELHVPSAASELTVIDPYRRRTVIQRTDAGAFQFHATDGPGIYEVRLGDQVTERFAVNFFDREESDVRLRAADPEEGRSVQPADIRIGELAVAATAGGVSARKEIWKAALAAALFVLLVEWYIYNRRVYL